MLGNNLQPGRTGRTPALIPYLNKNYRIETMKWIISRIYARLYLDLKQVTYPQHLRSEVHVQLRHSGNP